jgi:precorrin-6B methylase 2
MLDEYKILLIIFFCIAARAVYNAWKRIKRYLHHRKYDKIFFPLIEKIYSTTNGIVLSKNERERLNYTDEAFIYGEMICTSFSELLMEAAPKPGEVFYDLGAGTGKAVLLSSLLYPFSKCIGIELLPALHQVSLIKKKEFLESPEIRSLTHKPDIEFINADILKHDFSDADVIFINATCFTPLLWSGIVEKLKRLKIGTRIIVSSKNLKTESRFILIISGMYPMSWGLASVYVYKKIV